MLCTAGWPTHNRCLRISLRLGFQRPRPQVERNRPLQHSSGDAEERNVSGEVRGLQQQSVQPVDAMHDFGDPALHGLQLFQPRMGRRRRFKLQALAGLVPCPADLHQQRVPAALEVSLHPRRFFRIAFVAASFEAGRKTHLHLGINAARKLRVRCKLLRAAPQQKEIQRVVGILLGLGPRGKRTEVRAGRRAANGCATSPQPADRDSRRSSCTSGAGRRCKRSAYFAGNSSRISR